MKRFILAIMLCLLVAAVSASALEKVEAPMSCKVCGMSSTSFAQSRMLTVYADRTTVGTCSLHCTAITMHENHGRQISTIKVADFEAGKLIDAKTAVWVIGSRKKGFMSSVAQWAFANKQDAQAFIKINGGKLATFEQALKLAEMESTTHKH